ncbi:MAG: DUF3618 domain-containing protein [Actinobacteria bacterium]|jgi:CHASE3 domain sensor protein|uniref:Unannotated protein n=1 Tax=freshwater metagenome TaxID=449393 RepID=A0A6J6JP21_9ZZZZ|nr:DUF3618 domain-containing protein [Actinomycetota bacterium]MTA33356.1 DUF3618 domain-containing protein [Actinomycetota bacterium]
MSKKDVQTFVDQTRSELEETLDEIEHRLSPQELTKQATTWISESYDRNPTRWLVGGGIVLLGVVAAVLWAVFGDDD